MHDILLMSILIKTRDSSDYDRCLNYSEELFKTLTLLVNILYTTIRAYALLP